MSTNHNEEEVIEDKTLTRNDPVYLVMEMPDTGKYEITCVGIHCVDSDIDGLYDSFDTLPEWVKGRVAVLKNWEPCDLKSHPTREPQVEGVGSRFTSYEPDIEGSIDSFWILPEG